MSCAPPYSFYHDFIARYWAGGPSEGSGAPIHRICTLARKMGVGSVIVEDSLARPDIVEEIEHLQAATETQGDVRAFTVTFVRGNPVEDIAALHADAVLGQATIVTFPRSPDHSYIFEAIFRLPCKGESNEQLLNNHVPISSDMEIMVRGQAFVLPASYYCQQNSVTSICVHCAVRTLVRTLKGDAVSVRQLNEMWAYDPEVRSVRTDQVQDALRHFDLRPVTYDLRRHLQTVGTFAADNIWGLLALLADSGSPSLLVFSAGTPADHIVPILGHTFNSDEWHPFGEKLHVNGQTTMSSSNLWVDHLVIHDDMLGPYYCLSRAGLFPDRPGDVKSLVPKQAIAVIPEGVRLSPIMAEDFARFVMPPILKQIDAQKCGTGLWWDFFNKSFERRIFRTTLIHRSDYIQTLAAAAIDEDDRGHVATLETLLPERLWMCEITLPNLLLANRTKLGEFLIDAQAFPDEDAPLTALRAVRLPSLLGWARPDDEGGGFVFVPWSEQSHTPIRAPLHHANRW